MAILANGAYTLLDLANMHDKDGALPTLVNMLSQENAALRDIPWIEANQGMKHKTTQVTGLPAAYYRRFNEGVLPSKGTRATIEDTCAMLETYSFVDKDLAEINDNSMAWRLQEDKMFIDGINQQMARDIFYGAIASNAASFTGLAARYPTVQTSISATAVNVLDAGGQNSTNASMWFVGWGPNTTHGIYPKGSTAGLHVEDVTTNAPVDDGRGIGAKLRAYQTQYQWKCGIAVRDWRANIRIANIDVTALTSSGAANLTALMIAAVEKLPAASAEASEVQTAGPDQAGLPITAIRPVIYCNRTVRTALRLQILNKSNLLLQLEQWAGMPVMTFCGIPIRNMDSLLNTEARVV